MSIEDELLSEPAVIAAGKYTYKGEIASFKGDLSQEQAGIIAVMCHATTKNVAMEMDMLAARSNPTGLASARGWAIRGPQYSICVIADVFCVVRNDTGTFNDVATFLRQQLAERSMAAL